MGYIPVIGLEIHVELNTRTKMFCGCLADYFGKAPNTHTCPVCLGIPGALPVVNREALNKCMMLGLALNCSIAPISRFERKNYFYPDLPKGYQISQYRWPLCVKGYVDVSDGKRIRINRVHQEEDTAKLLHSGKDTIIDFNRSGVPLIEIVTEPDFEDSSQAVEFAKTLRQILLDLNTSNADMERGDLRLEANVSVREMSTANSVQELPNYRVELKNINSFRFMQHAIDYEIKRQLDELARGVMLTQETRGWDEDKKVSYLQRTKEESHDYRYFPEPDISELIFSERYIEKVREKMPKLSSTTSQVLANMYSLPLSSTATIVRQGLVDYFTESTKYGLTQGISAKDVANVLINKRLDYGAYSPKDFVRLLLEQKSKVAISDQDLEIAVVSVIKHNEKAVEDFKRGKESAIQFLLGQVMRQTKGQANADQARKLLLSKLEND